MTVPTPSARARWFSGRAPIPYLVLIAGLLATFGAGFYTASAARSRDEIRFDNAVQQTAKSISTKVDTYVALLRAGAGLFVASRDVTLDEFRGFVASIDLRGRYPGIQGMGFARRVGQAELPGLVQRMEAEGMAGFTVSPSDARRDYFPIVYLEPLDRRNKAAVGYDMFTDPVRRAAMEKAARTGLASASGKVVLKQEIDPEKQAGFLIYVPVYRREASLATDEDRMAALAGFVYSPFRAGDFLDAAVSAERQRQLDVKVYDGDVAHAGALLFDALPKQSTGQASPAPEFRRSIAVQVAGRTWLLDLSSAESFEASSWRRLLPWILFVGVSVSLMLFAMTRREVATRTAAERAALELKRSEEALRGSEAELRRLVEAERQAHAQAAAANRAKDEFLATLSHELRTPLNAILGWATMLKDGRLRPEQETRAVEIIARNARTQAELIEDLLDVSRIITGKLRLEMRSTTLSAAIQAALDAVRPTAEAKGVALESRVTTDGPVFGDPDRLQQVAWNLLSNAIKFTPTGGRVDASLEQQDGELIFTVRDNGMGIDPDFLPYVFERFRQHDSSTTRSHGGMGLGLAIVRHVVEQHGGSVRGESEGRGRGSTFVVRLPVRALKPREAGEPTGPGQPDADLILAGVRALVVDDERDSREMLSSMLAQVGAVVFTAPSAAEALRVLNHERIDVLLADISMPETDGYGLMREVRSSPVHAVRTVPAVAVTAYARQQDREKADQAGFQMHIAKPVGFDTLREAVRRLVAPV